MNSKTILFALFQVLFIQLTLASSHMPIHQGLTTPFTLPAKKVVLSPDLTFYYEFVDLTKTALMAIEITRDIDYVGIGFNNDQSQGMAGTDIIAFVFDQTGTITDTLDLWAIKNDKPPTDVTLGGSSDYKLLQHVYNNGKHQILFSRPYDTQDKYDYKFDTSLTGTNTAILWAFNDAGIPQLYYHDDNRGSVNVQLYGATQQITV